MTQTEYSEYEKRVSEFMENHGIQNLSAEPESEPFFSWRPCSCCGTHLGGNREKVTGYNPTLKRVYELVVCSDCVYYAEYGRLDDQAMMDIRASSTEEA